MASFSARPGIARPGTINPGSVALGGPSGSAGLPALGVAGTATVVNPVAFHVAATGTYTPESTTNTITLPATLTAGDLMIIAVDANDATISVTTPHTTFTKLASAQASGDTSATCEVWYAYAAGTSGTSTDASAVCTVTVSSDDDYPCTAFAAYSNAALVSPIDSHNTDYTTSGSQLSTIPCTAATTASANVLPISCLGAGGGPTETPTATAPTGYTIRSSFLGSYEGVAIADAALIANSGTGYGSGSWTYTGGGATVTFGIASVTTYATTGSPALAGPAMSGTATVTPAITTSGSAGLAALTPSGTGQVPFTSTGSAGLASLSTSGSVTVPQPVTSTGSAALAVLGVSGSSGENYATSGSMATGALGMSGSSTVANPVTSSGSAALSSLATSGTSGQIYTSTGSLALAALAMSGTEHETYGSTGSAGLAALAVSGSPTVANPVTTSGSVSLASLTTAGSETETYQASGSISLAPLVPSAAGQVPFTSTGTIGLAALATSGSESAATPVTSSGSAALASLNASGLEEPYVLNDDFTGTVNTLPNSGTWTPKQIAGAPSFGSTDTETYVSSTSILYQDGATDLIFKVGSEATDGAGAGTWPSARIDTGKPSTGTPTQGGTPQYAVQVGQSCEIRAKINTLAGTWPAIWFLGVDSQWENAYCEIDLAENYGGGLQDCTVWAAASSSDPTWANTGNPNQLATTTITEALDGGYHIYRLDYLEDEISLYRDGVQMISVTAAEAETAFPDYTWNFDSIGGMYVILNVATSESVTGVNPSAGALPAQVMAVDYVRIWSPGGPNPNVAATGQLYEDAGPAFATSGTGSVTTASFTPETGSLLVACAAVGNGEGEEITAVSVTDSSGTGAWTMLSGSALDGYTGWAGVWVRDAFTGSGTVTFTATGSGVEDCCLSVRQFAGALPAADQTGATAAVSGTSANTISITPTVTGSQVVGAFGTADIAEALTPNAATSLYGQYATGPGGDTEAAFESAGLSTASTALVLGFTNTAQISGFAAAEILAAPSLITFSGGAGLGAPKPSGSGFLPVTSTGSVGLPAAAISASQSPPPASAFTAQPGLARPGAFQLGNPGVSTTPASGSIGLGALGVSGTVSAAPAVTSSGSAGLPALAPSGTATLTLTSTGSAGLAALEASGSSVVANPVTTTGSVALGTPAPSGSGQVPFTSTGSAGLAAAATSGSATVAPPVSSSGTVGLGALATAGLAGIGNVVGSIGSAGLAAPGVSGMGQVPFTSSGSAGLASLATSGSVTIPQPVTSTGGVSLAALTPAGSGTYTFASSGSITLAALAPSGAGSVPFTSTGSIALGALATSGSETETFPPVTTSGGVALAALAPSGTVAVPFTTSGSIGLATPGASGAVMVPFTSAGSAGLGALATAGTASSGSAPVTTSGTVKLGALATSGSESEALPVTSSGSIALGAPGTSGSASAVTGINPSWDQSGTYTVTFEDEFTGSSLDTTKWTAGWQATTGISGPINATSTPGTDGEAAAYNSTNVSVSGGYLNLALTHTSVVAGGVTYPYTGSCVTTDPATLGGSDGFAQAGGAIEARIYLPASGGQIANWPAFWTDGQDWPATGETDIMEGLGGSAWFHSWTTNNDPGVGASAPGETPTASNYTGWHTFGVSFDATAGQCDYYYDGVLVGTIATNLEDAPQYLVINNTTGWQSGPEVAATVLVDWVRVWTPNSNPATLQPIGTLTDDFPSLAELYEKWTGSGITGVSGNQAELTCDANYDGQLQSITQYDCTGGQFYAKVTNPAGSVETGMVLTDQAQDGTANPVNAIAWQYDGTDLVASITQDATTTTIATLTYSATTHAYWRVSESGGNITWSTSASGSSWTTQGSHTHTISVEALYAWFWTGNDGSGTLTTYVSEVNGGAGPGFTTSGGVTLASLHPSGTGGPATHISGTGSIALPAANVRASGGQTGGPVSTSGSIALGSLSILRPPPPPPAPSTPGLAQPGYTTPGDAGLGAPEIYTEGGAVMTSMGVTAGQESQRLLMAFAF